MTGGETFLELVAFDHAKDRPVEILHTMMLGVPGIWFVGIPEQRQLKVHLRSYKSKTFARTMNSSLSLHKSFVTMLAR